MTRFLIRKDGLAWPEVLLVLALVLMMASIFIPVMLEIRNRQRSAAVYSDMKILISAAMRLNQEYRVWPSYDASPRGDVHYGDTRSNASVLNILQAVDGVGNEQHQANPSRINFIEQVSKQASPLKFNEKRELVDPWGEPYQMVFDSNYDNICSMEGSIYGSVIGQGVVIWSKGPDRKSESDDDLLSWKL